MSEVTPHHDAGHAGPIKTPKQLVVAVLFAFVVPIIAIILLVSYVAADKQPAAGSDAMSAKATVERIRPVGVVEVKDVSDPSALKNGEQVYGAVCVACHGTGTLNAPKLGDAAAWGPRLPQGFETLLTHALKGKGAMPAQGGGDYADLEIGRAVVYMANKAGGKLEEPKASAVQTAAAAPAAATTPAPAAAASAAAPAPTSAAAPQAAAATGGVPALYAQACSACHIAGVAGAPKLGDKAAWAPRLGQGVDGLTASVIKGKGAMPPKGGTTASEAEIKTVVTYMVSQAK
ncbi:MAG TPA: c-type cytochrome [Albitalea sp.]|uniref:c-type cytochrome n=1 Tax=Piscinibacter sp. TaxID=1903157 RepID=UPI002ED1255F